MPLAQPPFFRFAGVKLPKFSGVVANSADVPSIRASHSVLLGKLMPFRAMSFSSSSFRPFLSSYFGPLPKSALGFIDNLFIRASSVYPSLYCSGSCSAFFNKITKQVIYPVNSKDNRVSPISLLLSSRCPTAIIRAISLVVVNSIQRGSFRSRRHVGGKVGIRLHPAVANFDASSAIMVPRSGVWVGASLFHRVPDGIEGRRTFKWHDGFLQNQDTHLYASVPNGVNHA